MTPLKYTLFPVVGLAVIFIILGVQLTGRTHYFKNISRTRIKGRCEGCWEIRKTQISMEFVEALLKDNATYDINNLPSETTSRVHLNRNAAIKLGDVFTITVRLYDGNKRPLTRGGDVLAIRMWNYAHGAASVGHVVDHHNGSYTGMLRASWTGSVKISVQILYTREALSMYLRHMSPFTPRKTIMCVFKNKNVATETRGFPSVDAFKGLPFCNMTTENYGLAWYCGKPNNPLVCHDWVQFRYTVNKESQWTNKEKETFYVSAMEERTLRDTISVMISGRPDTATTGTPVTPCGNPDFTETWTQAYTSGFFYLKRWHRTSCMANIDDHTLRRCLSNRRLHVLGDSTSRQFFSDLYQRFNMTMVTEKWTVKRWHRYTEAQNSDMKFTMSWGPHELPIYYSGNRASARPLFVNIDEIPSGSNDLVIIHIYAHFRFHHPRVFRESIRRAAQSTRKLLQRSPRAVVGIKGTHYFRFPSDPIHSGFGLVYDAIIREEFSDMYSRVILINEWDLILASDILVLHPPARLVRILVDSFLGYACSR
ncbi:NXPE family member 3-like [Haliotis asinina]|uniref:NXPE family member 3-like n=1 Tax=Haliotis asinina TaxID=109174 RepID=UPI003531C41F